MKVSYTWLQNYFKDPLPPIEKLSDLFTFHVFEIEGVEESKAGPVLDVKVLPDRAGYALSHRGMAYEVSAICNIPKANKFEIQPIVGAGDEVNISIESDLCNRYMARKISGIKVAASPDWLKDSLESLGQRSINNIVDILNLKMFDIGQPMHAFDADKVSGDIVVRLAKAGEKITVLDGREVELKTDMLVIADTSGPLAIAGVKGGARAAVSESTKNIILESANFNPTSVRKTSTVLNLRSDSSKRYENNISPEFAPVALHEVTSLIQRLGEAQSVGVVTDVYPKPQVQTTFEVSSGLINQLLGINIEEKEVENILTRLEIIFSKTASGYTLTPPFFRRDLIIPEDIVEEVGRIYGYEKIPAILPPTVSVAPEINKVSYWGEKIKDILTEEGYSEVYTYSLTNKGDIEIQNPLASDKNFLRKNLEDGLKVALEFNKRNADLLGLKKIKIFEIGNIFTKKGEELHLCLSEPSEKITELLGKGTELNLTALIDKLPDPKEWDIKSGTISATYKPISLYPFIARDIAVFVPENSDESEIEKIIKTNSGELLVRLSRFDKFQKPGADKISYAFRLVFQSHDRTLTDAEVNSIMEKITAEMNAQDNWQVR